MNCFTCDQNLSAYIDDELARDLRRDIENHLAECDACRHQYDTQMSAWEIATTVETGATPVDLWSHIEARLPRRDTGTSIDDLARIVRGLASEVRELRRTVEDVRDRNIARSNYENDERVREQIRARPELSIWTEPGIPRRTGESG